MLAIRILPIVTGLLCAATPLVAETHCYSDHGIDGTGVFPAKDLVTEFWDMPEGTTLESFKPKDERKLKSWKRTAPPVDIQPGTKKNIVWRATLPHWGNNAPIVIQDRVFLLYEDSYKTDCPMLLCLDVHTGKTLWDKPVDHLDALPADVQSTAKAARAKEIKRHFEYMTWHNKIFYNNDELRWKTKEEAEADFPKLQAEAKAAGWLFNNAYLPSGYSRTRARMGLKFGNLKKDGGIPADKSLIDNAKLVNQNRWHQRQGWTTEQPWYGNTHGSVVSNGTTIFAVTAIGGAAAYDLDGKLLWVEWLNPEERYRSGSHGHVASPTIAGDTLLYFHRDAAIMYGMDIATGKVRFATKSPAGGAAKGGKGGKPHPRSYFGHMGPGTTPIVLDLGGEQVVVSGNGMVVRVRDGHLLGCIDGQQHSYFNMTGADGVYYTTFMPSEKKGKRLIGAVRLGIDGDQVTQERLWTCDTAVGNWEAGSNLAIDGDKLYLKLRGEKGGATGMCVLDAATGKVIAKQGPMSEYFAVGDTQYVTKSSGRAETRFRAMTVTDKATMKKTGWGFLAEPPATGEIAERHIGFLGWPEIWTGYQKVSIWGNRIFVRTNDYLWCVGDPDKPFTAPAPIGK